MVRHSHDAMKSHTLCSLMSHDDSLRSRMSPERTSFFTSPDRPGECTARVFFWPWRQQKASETELKHVNCNHELFSQNTALDRSSLGLGTHLVLCNFSARHNNRHHIHEHRTIACLSGFYYRAPTTRKARSTAPPALVAAACLPAFLDSNSHALRVQVADVGTSKTPSLEHQTPGSIIQAALPRRCLCPKARQGCLD